MVFFYFVALCSEKKKSLNNKIKRFKNPIFYNYTSGASHKCLLARDANAPLGFCRYLVWKDSRISSSASAFVG